MNKIFVIFLLMFCMPTFAYISENMVGACNGDINFVRVFVPNQYNCDAGYFLPASTDGCRPCPYGYNCPGGTYSFNEEIAQGINVGNKITHDTNNTCSANFIFAGNTNHTVNLAPIFVPNETITVNFTNGEDTETVTCIYDTELTVPTPPTRVGYVFTGWKVKNE